MNSEEEQKCGGFFFSEPRSAPGGSKAPARASAANGRVRTHGHPWPDVGLHRRARPSLQGITVPSAVVHPEFIAVVYADAKRELFSLALTLLDTQPSNTLNSRPMATVPKPWCAHIHVNPNACSLLSGQINVQLPLPILPCDIIF